MSAAFSLSSADVRAVNVEHQVDTTTAKVQIVVRAGKATLKNDRGEVVEQKDGVLLSNRISRGEWAVTFMDGTRWEVLRNREGCRSCG